MAKEIQFGFPAALNLYAQVLNATGSIYRTDSTAFEAYSTSNYANYNITMTQQGTASQLYMADFPSAIATAGVYTVVVRQRLGGSPAESDPVVGGGVIQWSGSAVLPLSSVTDKLPAALVDGRIDAHVGACGANVLTASALASDAVAEIQSGLSTLDGAGVRSAIGLAAANLDSQIAAIQAQTDQLDFSGDDGMLLSESTNAGGDCPTAGEIAEAVWEHDLSSPHLPQTAAGRVSASYAASAKFETMIIAEGLVYVFTESALQNAPTGVGGGGGSVVVTSPVSATGAVRVTIGDDYLHDDGKQIAWSNPGWSVEDAELRCKVRFPDGIETFEGVVSGPSGGYIELTRAQTEEFPEGIFRYDLEFTLPGGGVFTPIRRGTFRVSPDTR